jgi:hypothetical protein
MSKFVVSANYRDRSSSYRWLVRRYDEPIEKAVACKRVVAKGVRFQASNQGESGFGCTTVAVCDSAELFDQETLAKRLRFDGVSFLVDEKDGPHVSGVNELQLGEAGEILAVL